MRKANPELVAATLLIADAILSKEIAHYVDGPLRGEIAGRADKTILYIADEYCGTTGISRKPPRPMPGPPVMALQLAVSITTFANVTIKSERMREEFMKVAGDLTTKAYAS